MTTIFKQQLSNDYFKSLFYEEGSFISTRLISQVNPTPNPSGEKITIEYIRIGNQLTLFIPTFDCFFGGSNVAFFFIPEKFFQKDFELANVSRVDETFYQPTLIYDGTNYDDALVGTFYTGAGGVNNPMCLLFSKATGAVIDLSQTVQACSLTYFI